MKKKILAVLCAALIICLGVVSAFAIQPPSLDISDFVVNYSSPPVLDHANKLIDIANMQYTMTTFNNYFPVLLAWRSNQIRLYVVRSSYSIIDDGTNITISDYSSVNYAYGMFSFGNGGFLSFKVTDTHIFSRDSVIAFCPPGGSSLVFNDAFVSGDSNFSYVDSAYNAWKTYYDKVFNYDENIESSYNQGYVDGGADGYSEAYGDGYADGSEDGYETGYSEGLSTGYASGLAQGEALGLQQGRQEGYETGYDEGYSDGDADGYDRGYAGGLNVGRQEGYETGYSDGLEDGYETGYADGLEAGGGGSTSDLIPFELTFYLSTPIRVDVENGDPITIYRDYMLTWKNNDPETLGFRDPEDEDEGQLAGFYAYHVLAYFSPQQVSNPSSVNFSIPSEIVSLVPTAEFASITFDPYEVIDGDRVANVYLVYDQYYLGYNKGFQDGGNILDALGTVAAAPVTGLAQALDFDLFGVNVRVIVIGVIAVLLAFVAWKLIKKFIPV